MIVQGDATRLPLADKSVDLVFGSPPYMDARTYGINAQRKCLEWIDWMLEVTTEACRVSRGLVLWVVGGVTRKHCYWPGPEGLLYEWWNQGGQCWRPAYWHRVGIAGSGGKQWLRADVEYVLAFKAGHGPIPWSDNTANGRPPKWRPGGKMSHRVRNGSRVTRLGRNKCNGIPGSTKGRVLGRRVPRGSNINGETIHEDVYVPPEIANPGTLVRDIPVGGGLLGSKLAHKNEAPFPQKLAEWFIRSWCPPGGTVLDPFSGSGTTVAAALALGRRGIGIDIRASQCELALRRTAEVQLVAI